MAPSHGIRTFIEDTGLLIALAYLLTRGRTLIRLFERRLGLKDELLLGIVMGALGLTEAVSPGARFPYSAHTLLVTFAAVAWNPPVSFTAAAIVSAGAFALQPASLATGIAAASLLAAIIGSITRNILIEPHPIVGGMLAGMLVQSLALVLRNGLQEPMYTPYGVWQILISTCANGFGVMLLQMIVTDARIRARSERHRIEAEQARALAARAQLTALRARLHPHFLFNTLNAIAALCDERRSNAGPERAREAILRLSDLMRRVLRSASDTASPLPEEISAVETYVAIEKERFGDKLRVEWDLHLPPEDTWVPPFAIQALAENAINHGVAAESGKGTVRIAVRTYPRHVLVAVMDTGRGMEPSARREAFEIHDAPDHALQIINQHLMLRHGPRARLRFYVGAERGTLAVFILPRPHGRAKRV
ncbi:MAG: sensor histidine kinase [Chthonomonadales bacterium]